MAFALIVALVPIGAQGVRAGPGSDAEATIRCANREVFVKTCTRFACANLFSYSPNTLISIVGMESGDREAGNDQWLHIVDPLMRKDGYAHSTFARECTPPAWQTKPIFPTVSKAAREVYEKGIKLGNNPRAFSKVGDCQNVDAYFLSDFDRPLQYNLGPYTDLQPAIDQFGGSFSRQSEAVNPGFNVASVLSTIWANPTECKAGENPLECEYRLHRPSIVIISMETWWDQRRPVEIYEDYLGKIVEFWMARGVVPILATKADNLEFDGRINAAIVRVAEKYDMPLWNFWRAAQSLPNGGLTEDRFHLVYARNFYNNPARLRDGWPVRNLTALEALNTVWRGVAAQVAAVPTEQK